MTPSRKPANASVQGRELVVAHSRVRPSCAWPQSAKKIGSNLGLKPGWTERRTEILSRFWATEEDTLSGLAAHAGDMALANAGIERNDIGLLLLATSTPDHLLPPSAPLIAHCLGLGRAPSI